MIRPLLVTDADVRLIDLVNDALAGVVYTYPDVDAGRRAQFAAMGDTLFVTSEDGEGEPEVPVAVVGATGYEYRGPGGRAFVPDPSDVTVARSARTAGEGGGLTFGRYAVRYAVVFRDGSRGPASMPVVVDNDGPLSYPYTITAHTPSSPEITVTGTAAHDDATALLAAYGGPFPAYVEGVGTVTVVGSAIDGTDTVLTLSENNDAVAGTEDIALGDRAYLHVTTAGALDVDGWTAAERDVVYDRVAVLLSPPIEEDAEAYAVPYFEVGSLPLAVSGGALLRMSTAALLARGTYEEAFFDTGVRASRCGALNGRLYLGDVAFDPPKPDAGPFEGEGEPTGDNVLLRVSIRTDSGTVYRWSDPLGLLGGGPTFPRVAAYPDPRAFALDVYYDIIGGVYAHYATYALRPSLTVNAAIGTTNEAAGLDAPPDAAAREAENAVLDPGPRRVLQSGYGRPYGLALSRLANTGATAADEVLAIAPMADALSSGQFGDFPLLVGCRSAWYAVRFSGDGTLAGFHPLENNRGPVGPYAFAADGRALYYLASDGLYVVGNPARLSAPLHVPEGARPPAGVTSAFAITSDAAVGVYDDGTRREIWVATGEGEDRATWALSLTAPGGWWVRLDRPRAGFVQLGGGIPEHAPATTFDAGTLYGEAGGDAPEDPSFTTAPVPFAGGLGAQIARVGIAADASGALDLTILERARGAAAPGERAPQVDTALVTLALSQDHAYETGARCAVRRPAFHVAYSEDEQAQEGDRFVSLAAALKEVVRKRRRRLLNI